MISAFRRTPRSEATQILDEEGRLFFYRPFHRYFFPENEYEDLFFATLCAENVVRFCYGASAIIFLSQTQIFQSYFLPGETATYYASFWLIMNLLGFILASFILGDYLPRIFGTRMPEKALSFCAPITSVFLFLVFPITYFFLRISHTLSRTIYFDHSQAPETQAKNELIHFLKDTELRSKLDIHDKKLISSVLTFGERIAREVMVPRVEVFSLAASTPINEAAKLIEEEGYSRIPIYEENVDEITGVVMYKDILRKYMEEAPLDAPIQTLKKSVLYTPETKKISLLLQEFRKEQSHIAIVVDEYGGTEGIITIEDILEEIVGEIADEYDTEEDLYVVQPDGSWVIDGRMNILDLEEEVGIKLPQEGEYDTVAGFIVHCTGDIPTENVVIHHDQFEIEILKASERQVEKVKIKSTS